MIPLRGVEEPLALSLAASPEVTVKFHSELARSIGERDLLTPLQVSSSLLAIQAISSEPYSFFLGHGPGVGKTRILAAIARHVSLSDERRSILWLVPNMLLCKQTLKEAQLLGLLACQPNFRVASYAQIREQRPPPENGFLLILDEAHTLRGCTRTNNLIGHLQNAFQCVVYSTATSASQVSHLGYMQRLKIWGRDTPFTDFSDFTRAMKRWGPAASEMLALDLKQRGLYVCSRLPAQDLRALEITPSMELTALFDRMCTLWGQASHCSSLDLRGFMKRLVTSIKCRSLIPRWKEDLHAGYAVVIILQGTGAASEHESLLKTMCRRNGVVCPDKFLFDAIQEVQCGLAPVAVAEVTGRPVAKRQISETQKVCGNAKEVALFQCGERRVLCLTAAGALGLNLVSPLPTRVYVLEASWTPEVLSQQLGRCNRLTSPHPPECFSVSMKTFVEKRVEIVLSGRAQTMSALTCADRSFETFSFLTWSKKLVRLVCLELTTRFLAETLPEDDLKDILRRRRELNCLCKKRYSTLSCLDLSQELLVGGAPNHALLELILQSNPYLCEKLYPTWVEEGVDLLSREDRSKAYTTILCLQRKHLPTSIINIVLKFAIPSPWSARDLLDHSPQGADLLESNLEQFFNAAALLPMEHQRRLYQACEESFQLLGEKPHPMKTVVEYCCGRKEPPLGFSVCVRTEVVSDATRKVYVVFQNEVARCASPRLFQTSSGHIVHACQAPSSAWGYPGRPPLERSNLSGRNPPTLRDVLPRSALNKFRDLETKNILRRQGHATTISHELLLRVKSPLQHWDASLELVLAVPGSSTQGSFVGLLMSTDKVSARDLPSVYEDI